MVHPDRGPIWKDIPTELDIFTGGKHKGGGDDETRQVPVAAPVGKLLGLGVRRTGPTYPELYDRDWVHRDNPLTNAENALVG